MKGMMKREARSLYNDSSCAPDGVMNDCDLDYTKNSENNQAVILSSADYLSVAGGLKYLSRMSS